MLSLHIPNSGGDRVYNDEPLTHTSYVVNLNRLLAELPPLSEYDRRRLIEVADQVAVEFVRSMARLRK